MCEVTGHEISGRRPRHVRPLNAIVRTFNRVYISLSAPEILHYEPITLAADMW